MNPTTLTIVATLDADNPDSVFDFSQTLRELANTLASVLTNAGTRELPDYRDDTIGIIAVAPYSAD